MYVCCEQCKSQIGEQKPQTGLSLPIFSVVGGIIGTLGTVLTGGLVLIPAALVAGAAGDVLRHCCLCNREIKEHEPCYQPMQSLDNDLHGQTFRPLSEPLSQSSNTTHTAPQFPTKPTIQPSQLPSQIGQGAHIDSKTKENECSSPQEFVIDRIEGKLVPLGLPDSELNDSDMNLVDLFKTDPIGEKNIPLASRLPDDPFTSDINMPIDLANDFSINPESFGSTNEPSLGEPLL